MVARDFFASLICYKIYFKSLHICKNPCVNLVVNGLNVVFPKKIFIASKLVVGLIAVFRPLGKYTP